MPPVASERSRKTARHDLDVAIEALLLATVCAIALAACTATSEPTAADAAVDRPELPDVPGESQPAVDMASAGDLRSEFYPGCHYDCFGSIRCRDGVVTLWYHVPVSCQYWTGECPHKEVAQCQRGCFAEEANHFECPLTLCRENHSRRAGDACQVDRDCQSTRAETNDEIVARDGGSDASPDAGGAGQTDLRCDKARRTCVEVAAPPLRDWLAPCDPKVLANREKGSAGAVLDPSCSGGLCLAVVPLDQPCIYQGCTRHCNSDDDCPQGAVCYDATPAACRTDAGAQAIAGYCRPAPPNDFGVGLTCR